MDSQMATPPPIHWFARLLALLLALLGVGMMVFAVWALIFKPQGNRVDLIGVLPAGLLLAGVCGWIAVLGRVGPQADMSLDASSPRTPLTVRIWAGVICVLSPILAWSLLWQNAFKPGNWYGWLNVVVTSLTGIWVFVLLARLCLSSHWPAFTLRFARRANMTGRQQSAETRREHEHSRRF